MRALTTAYANGFRDGYDAMAWVVSVSDDLFSLEDIARCNDETEDAARARIERGREAFVALGEGRPQIMNLDDMSQATAGLLFESVDVARTKLGEKVAEEKAKLPARVVAPALTASGEPTHCLQCGVSLPPAPATGGRPRRFCSARCRAQHFRGGL